MLNNLLKEEVILGFEPRHLESIACTFSHYSTILETIEDSLVLLISCSLRNGNQDGHVSVTVSLQMKWNIFYFFVNRLLYM